MTRKIFIIFLILFLISLGVIFLNQSRAVLFLKHFSGEILRPFEIAASAGRNWFFFWQSAIFNIKSIKDANIRLTGENLELYGKVAKLAVTQEENSLLREQLNLSKKSITVTLAAVIGHDYQSNRSFVISKGTVDGVKNGMIVISNGESVVGRIADAGYNFSKVQTILDAQSRIAAITGTTRVSGLARGLGSDIIFDLIAKDKKPETGELIISSGTDGIWPRGLVIGKVKEIKSSDNQVFNTADVETIVNITEINDVFIITNER